MKQLMRFFFLALLGLILAKSSTAMSFPGSEYRCSFKDSAADLLCGTDTLGHVSPASPSCSCSIIATVYPFTPPPVTCTVGTGCTTCVCRWFEISFSGSGCECVKFYLDAPTTGECFTTCGWREPLSGPWVLWGSSAHASDGCQLQVGDRSTIFYPGPGMGIVSGEKLFVQICSNSTSSETWNITAVLSDGTQCTTTITL